MRFELCWSDIGQAKLSGRYSYRGGEIDVQARHIYAWEQDPDGIWQVFSHIGHRGRTHFGILGFEPSATFEQMRAANPALRIFLRGPKSTRNKDEA